MKKLFIFFLAYISFCELSSQTSVDYFCGTELFEITVLKNQGYEIRILGKSRRNLPVGMNAGSWGGSNDATRRAAVVTNVPANIYITANEIINFGAHNNAASNEVDVLYWDTLVISNLIDIYNESFASVLATQVQTRFNATCPSLNFDAILQVLEAKFNKEHESGLVNVLEKSIGVGIGLGPNFRFKPQYDYYISPYDSTLRQDRVGRTSFVASLLLIWNPLFAYRKFLPHDSDVATGALFRAPGPIGFCLGLNFADVNPNDLDFNLKLSGGFGITVNLGSGFQAGVFCDLTREKILRQEIRQLYLGKKYPFNNTTEIDQRFYTVKTVPSISIKAIYRFKVDKSEPRPGIGQYLDRD